MRQLEGSEILYGFCAWLTSRKEITVMSVNDDAACISDLIDRFCEANGIDDPKAEWKENLLYPI